MDFDAAQIMAQPLELDGTRDGPQVLIFHTHSREAYNETGEAFVAPDVTHNNDTTRSVVAVGAILAQTLEAGGIEVIHCTDIFDSTYTGAYSRSDAAVTAILEQNPSIRVVLDLHRDAVYTSEGGKYRPVVEKDGMDVAQIMMIAGTGNDEDDVNPHWQDNVRFGLTLQSEVEAICPGITRAMMVRTSTYNQNRSKGALLIEVGTTGNTLTEAKRSAYYIGQALCQVLA
jgi:stage II sporulation protein P